MDDELKKFEEITKHVDISPKALRDVRKARARERDKGLNYYQKALGWATRRSVSKNRYWR